MTVNLNGGWGWEGPIICEISDILKLLSVEGRRAASVSLVVPPRGPTLRTSADLGSFPKAHVHRPSRCDSLHTGVSGTQLSSWTPQSSSGDTSHALVQRLSCARRLVSVPLLGVSCSPHPSSGPWPGHGDTSQHLLRSQGPTSPAVPITRSAAASEELGCGALGLCPPQNGGKA